MKTIEHTLFNYRSTPHSTTRVTPFEALFERKMRDKLTSLGPEEVLQGKAMDRVDISKRIDAKKHRHDGSRQTTVPTVNVGDLVRIKGPDGTFRNPQPAQN